MKRILYCLMILLTAACTQEKKQLSSWKTIEVGEYQFDVPPSFEFISEDGIDSDVGKLSGDGITFRFDFGYYSNTIVQSAEEFLQDDRWEINAAVLNHHSQELLLPDVQAIRPAKSSDSSFSKGCDFIASCTVNGKSFDYPIALPAEIRAHRIISDTTGIVYSKIIAANVPGKGSTGIYLKRLNSYNNSINSYLALSLSAENLTFKQQQLALKILKTWRLNPAKTGRRK